MALAALTLWLSVATFTTEPHPVDAGLILAPRVTSPRCQIWLSTPAQVPFSKLASRVAEELRPASSIELREWTASSQPGATGWWIRIAETRGQWQIAYLAPDGKVELEALPILDPSTLEADIAGEVALVALSSCSAGLDLASGAGMTSSSPDLPSGIARSRSASRRGASLLGATIGLGTLGLIASTVGFGLSFHYYRGFKTDVDNCTFDTFSGSQSTLDLNEVYQGCRTKHERTLRMHWYMSGIGTAGTVVLGSGLVLAIPTVIEHRRTRGPRAELRLLGWAGSRGAGFGLTGRF